jgi:hypothetical protein
MHRGDQPFELVPLGAGPVCARGVTRFPGHAEHPATGGVFATGSAVRRRGATRLARAGSQALRRALVGSYNGSVPTVAAHRSPWTSTVSLVPGASYCGRT